MLDFVGDVRDDLDRGAEVVAAPFLADDVLVNAPGGEIVGPVHAGAHEPFVVAQVQVSLRAVLGHEYLAVLERAHGARIHVDVGIELEQGGLDTAGFEQGTQRRGRDPLA